jgi:HK97 family phage major capsid protein
MKKSDELKKVVNEISTKVEAAQQAEQFEEAGKLADELTAAVNSYKAAKALEDAELDAFKGTAAPVKAAPKADAATMNRVFNKLVLGRPLDDAEREVYAANRKAFDSPGTPGQVEATAAKGGYLVPTEQLNILYEYRRMYSQLRDYCNVFQISKPTGKFPAIGAETGKLTSFEEITQITAHDVDFSQVTWETVDYGDIIPISNQLIADADFSIMSIIGQRLARKAVNTENDVIVSAINTELSSPTTITTYKQLLKALNVTLDRAFFANARIFLNQDAFQWLSTLEDAMNRPLLVPDVAIPDSYRFRGKEVVVVPNSVMPTVTVSSDDLAPIYVGSMADFVGFFERAGVEIATSTDFMFDKYATAMRAVLRFGVSILDDDALIKLQVKVN